MSLQIKERRCSFTSDAMRLERTSDGMIRYFRDGTKEHEEYCYRRPFILELELTRRCNLKCVHCYAEAEDRFFSDELTLEEITRVLDQAVEIGIPEVSLTGGEVFLHSQFLDVIDSSLQRKRNVRFVTNATWLNKNLLSELCRRPIKLITVSLDAVTPEIHEQIRGPGSHTKTLENIHALINAGFKVSIITAFSRLNLSEFDNILEFCVHHKIDWQVQLVAAKGRCRKSITLAPTEYYKLGEKVAHAFVAGLPINIIPMDDMATFSHFSPLNYLSRTWQGRCTGGLLNIFVRANGDITPCSALVFPECVVGNLRTDSLVDICKEQRCKANLEWLSAETRTGICASCPFLNRCSGGCPEILSSMCRNRTENEYCYHRIEEERILNEVL